MENENTAKNGEKKILKGCINFSFETEGETMKVMLEAEGSKRLFVLGLLSYLKDGKGSVVGESLIEAVTCFMGAELMGEDLDFIKLVEKKESVQNVEPKP